MGTPNAILSGIKASPLKKRTRNQSISLDISVMSKVNKKTHASNPGNNPPPLVFYIGTETVTYPPHGENNRVRLKRDTVEGRGEFEPDFPHNYHQLMCRDV